MTEHHDRHTMERMREPAVWRLSDKGALVPDREANERLTNTAGAQNHDFTCPVSGGPTPKRRPSGLSSTSTTNPA